MEPRSRHVNPCIRAPPSRDDRLPNGHHAEEECVSPTEDYKSTSDVAELTKGISSVEITANRIIKTPTDLNDVLGKGFSFNSFAKLLEAQDIFVLESHFKWIFEIGKLDGPLNEKRIEMLYNKMKDWESESDDHLSMFQSVAQKLLLAVYSGLLNGYTGEVRKYFDEAKQIMGSRNKTSTDKQLEVYQYIMLCDTILMNGASQLLSPSENRSLTSLKIFKAEIALLDSKGREVFAEDLFKAVFLGMKAHISAQLGKTTMAVEFYRRAAKLDPNCFDWIHHYYTHLRRQRRENDFGAPPGKEESDACYQAIGLCSDDWISLLAHANLLEDTKRARRPSISLEDRQELDAEIIDILTQAQAKAPNNVSVNLKLAEAYLNKDQATDEDYAKSKEFFESCLRKWPNNSQVLHKLGKYWTKRDKTTGIKYFEKAVKIDPQNFPCFMDYLKEKSKTLNMLEMVSLIDEFLPYYQYKKVYKGKLLSLKGYLQWVGLELDSTDAVKTWLEIFDNDDKSEKQKLGSYLMDTLHGKNVPYKMQQVIQFNTLTAVLRNPTFMTRINADPSKVEEFVALLNADQPRPNSQRYSDRINVGEDNQNWRYQSTNSRRQNEGSRGYWSGHLERNQTIAPLGNRSSTQNSQENISQNDVNWRQRGPTVSLPGRSVALMENEDLRVTTNTIRERRGGGDADSTARRNRQPENNSRIRLDSHGRWEQVNLEDENFETRNWNPKSGKRHGKNGT